ncbi:ABC transporter permease [Alphaproteobacteria bacterium]|jgi:rhamnose transport system permease protein|nr:ABC transporter permease [Alphaproteobacteria bacterium]MDB4184534.1 ABC transporter permease [Alphaproteobacteria bacterium]MDB9825456.1 ABC transporter permease [Alphaproteobacteria bacterium]
MKKFLLNRDFILFAIICIGLISVGFANPLFITPSSISDVLTDTSILIILALSQMIVILIRAIDLSVASNLALSGMLISLLSTVYPELPVYYFIALSCIIGTILGVLNGVSIAILKVPFIVTTLGTMSIYRGLIYFVSDGKQVYSSEFSEDFLDLIHFKFLSLSFLFWLAVAVFIIFYILLNHTRFGRNLYSLGGNPDAAKYIGINENKYIILAYSISGLFAGLCGYLWVARYSVASTQIAIGFELTVISACVVGGISVMGGVGTVLGCLLGALLIGLIRNALPAVDISQFWQLAISGAIILLAIIINTKTEQRKEKTVMVQE